MISSDFRRLSFSNYEERKSGADKLERDGQALERLFKRLVPEDEEGISNVKILDSFENFEQNE